MSFRLTQNLKLRIDDNLTQVAVSNLEKIDRAFSTLPLSSSGSLTLRSGGQITLSPNDSTLGGSGTGTVSVTGKLTTQQFCLTDGTNQLTLALPALAASYSLTLPPDTGVSGQVLTTDGTGVTTWGSPAGSLTLNDLTDVTITTPSANQALVYNGTAWVNSTIPGQGGELAQTWTAADGLELTINHNFGSLDVMVHVVDLTERSVVIVNDIEYNDTNNITLRAVDLPGASGYRVLLKQIV